MKRKPNMQDVADAAGVSLMTVSYALRNHPSISPQTRERVQRVASEIGYSRNPLVSALMAQIRSTKTVKIEPIIGYLSCFADRANMLSNPFRRAYYEGATKRCEELGFRMELFELKENTPRAGKRLSEVMHYRNVRGLVCGPTAVSGSLVPMEWSYFASCAIGYYIRTPQLHQVNANYSMIARLAMERIRQLGYRRIGFICTSLENERVRGEALAGISTYNRPLPLSERVATAVLSPRHWNFSHLEKWIKSHHLDALVFQNHTPYGWLLPSSIKVPRDLAVATLERRGSSELAGVEQCPEVLGAAAVDVVVDQLHQNSLGIPSLRKVVLLDGVWEDGVTAPSKSVEI